MEYTVKKDKILMSDRQWRLYEFLKANTDRWLTMAEIAYHMPDDYGNPYMATGATYHMTNERKWMTADIEHINAQGGIQKIIMTCNRGVRLAMRDEYKEYLNKRRFAVLRSLKRVNDMVRKADLDGQYRYHENSERPYIEAFGDDVNIWKAKRKLAGYKQAEVVEFVKQAVEGFDQPTLSLIESGKVEPNEKTVDVLKVLYEV